MKWLATLLVFVMMGTFVSAAQIEPASLSYQGALTDNSGQALTGIQHIRACLYNEISGTSGLIANGGTAFWCDEYDVALQDGRFSIVLGRDGNALTGLLDQFNGTTYVGLTVGNEPEMAIRQKLTSVPYALKAETANNGVPIGTIVAWHKSFTGTPALQDGWVECNGQTLSDPESPYDGQIIPNLNAPKDIWNEGGSFLRGGQISGGFQVDTFQGHGHDVALTGTNFQLHREASSSENEDVETSGAPLDDREFYLSELAPQLSATTPEAFGVYRSPRYGAETRPVNMFVVWIMKIK